MSQRPAAVDMQPHGGVDAAPSLPQQVPRIRWLLQPGAHPHQLFDRGVVNATATATATATAAAAVSVDCLFAVAASTAANFWVVVAIIVVAAVQHDDWRRRGRG